MEVFIKIWGYLGITLLSWTAASGFWDVFTRDKKKSYFWSYIVAWVACIVQLVFYAAILCSAT